MSRRLLFHRDFREYSGGHGKVWDYFCHTNAHPEWQASVFLTPESTDADNPWRSGATQAEPSWEPGRADALFLGGLDWSANPADDLARPVINLVQHVRHALPGDERFPHLSRRAIRICVSQAVADAIEATGRVNGPVRVIPAALDLGVAAAAAQAQRWTLIGAIKHPALGRALADRLRAAGRHVRLIEQFLPRAEYLAELGRCRVAVMLPSPTEGFYLPGLEAMALGCATVVPDCLGNREYLQPGINALAPVAELEALVDAVTRLDNEVFAAGLVAAGQATAAQFTQQRERAAFHAILDELDTLWTR